MEIYRQSPSRLYWRDGHENRRRLIAQPYNVYYNVWESITVLNFLSESFYFFLSCLSGVWFRSMCWRICLCWGIHVWLSTPCQTIEREPYCTHFHARWRHDLVLAHHRWFCPTLATHVYLLWWSQQQSSFPFWWWRSAAQTILFSGRAHKTNILLDTRFLSSSVSFGSFMVVNSWWCLIFQVCWGRLL